VLSNGPIGKNVSLALANLGQPKVYLIMTLLLKPLDEKSYTTYLKHLIITLEDGTIIGGFGILQNLQDIITTNHQ
jgi:1-deoxy-D-xylulose-5-phosphate synthase